MIGLGLIATGTRYHKYVVPLLESAKQHFIEHEVLLFTDCKQDFGVEQEWRDDLGFPFATLMRYHAFLDRRRWFEKFSHTFYCDIDMLFVDGIVEDEVLSDGITAVMHAGFVGTPGTPENRRESTAYLERPRTYFAGGFVGGKTSEFMAMSEVIARNVDEDLKRGIVAVWHDESHLNRYLFDNPPSKILTPSFCHAYYRETWRAAGYECGFEPKIKALTKE